MSLSSLLEDPIIEDLLASKTLRYSIVGYRNGQLCTLGASKAYRDSINFDCSTQHLVGRYGTTATQSMSHALNNQMGWIAHLRIDHQWKKVDMWCHGEFGVVLEQDTQTQKENCPKREFTHLEHNHSDLSEETTTLLLKLTADGTIVHHNPALNACLGRSNGCLAGLHLKSIIREADRPAVLALLEKPPAPNHVTPASFAIKNLSGQEKQFDWTFVAEGDLTLAIGKLSQHYLQEALLQSQSKLHNILESMDESFFAIDDNGLIVHVNHKGAELLGQSPTALLGRPIESRAPTLRGTPLFACLNQAIEKRRPENFQWEDRLSKQWYSVRAYPGKGLISVFLSDISDIKKTETHAKHQALHDPLTGLPNRLSVKQSLSELVNEQNIREVSMALLFLDLDGFKNINDTLGHNAGDELLREVAKRLQNSIRGSDIVARLSGDEFVIALPFIDTREDAYAVACKVVYELSHNAYTLNTKRVYVGASIGVSTFPHDSQTVEGLMKNADIAMYEAKQSGKNTVRLYSPDMSVDLSAQLDLETDLHEALRERRFEAHYQPRFNIHNQVVGAEALVRMRDREGNLVSPGEFIPLAEKTGLIVPLGLMVLEMASQWAVELNKQLIEPIVVSVNVSGAQLFAGKLPNTVAATLDRYHLAPTLLELELTETMLLQNKDNVVADLHTLNKMGVKLSVDDFGTGYSSLSLLQKMPVQKIKLDQSFVKGLPDQHDNIVISKSVSALAQAMGLEVVAEGVETPEQHAFLIEAGFHELQGFGLARPMPADKAKAFILNAQKVAQFSGGG